MQEQQDITIAPRPQPASRPTRQESNGGPRFHVYTESSLDKIPQIERLSATERFNMQVVANVLPFRVNPYVLDQLIDWDNIPADPIFQLTFPQTGMLAPTDFERMAELIKAKADRKLIKATADDIRLGLNPHPAGQQALNVPTLDGEPVSGMQHKYRETVLFFPTQGQTCHAYCTFCFRWAQFVGIQDLKFASTDAAQLHAYLAAHPQVSDILFTGGDPLVMKTRHLAAYLLPLLEDEYRHVQTIRIGSKALSYWPYRFTTDPDADALLELCERLVKGGKHVALMAHYNHWRELGNPGRPGRHSARPRHRGGHSRPRPPDRPYQRRCRGLGSSVAQRGPARDCALLYVRRARHRRPPLFRGAAGQGVGDLPPGAEPGLGFGPHRARPVDERRTGQGRGPGRDRDRRRKSLCLAFHSGPQLGLGPAAVLCPL